MDHKPLIANFAGEHTKRVLTPKEIEAISGGNGGLPDFTVSAPGHLTNEPGGIVIDNPDFEIDD